MSKKLKRSVASIACAALMASQVFAFDASAIESNNGYYYYYNGVYYSYDTDAQNASGGAVWEAVPSEKVPVNATEKWIDPKDPTRQFSTKKEAEDAGVTNPHRVYVGSYYNNYYNYSYGAYYSSYTGKYYSTYEAALAASNGISSYVTYAADYYYYNYNYGYYYSSYTGKYYSTYEAALAASRGISSYVTHVGYLYNRYYDGAAGSIYRYYYNGVAYPSLDAAIAAGGTVGVDIYFSPIGNTGDTKYYYYYNGTYYGSLEAAKNAGGTALGVDISYVPYGYYGKYNNYYGYYGYYGYGYLTDPYLAYKNIFKTSRSKAEEAEDGEPYIYGRKTQAGWKTIIKYINGASKGTNIKVNMNGCNVVADDVFDALDGKNVSVTFILDNGVKWTVNGKNIDDPKDVNIYTEYDIDYIPASLVKKASKGAVSKAQVGVSNSFNDLGTTASVTVKFNKKRADLTAVVYLYNPQTNSLKAVYKSKVQSDGSCTFTVDQGGPYLIVLK